jgi:glycosyltransferase involved in cell wall biosynthesis
MDVTGVLVPPGDAARLREVLEELLADAGWRAHLGAEARKRAEELAPERAGQALREAYGEALRVSG